LFVECLIIICDISVEANKKNKKIGAPTKGALVKEKSGHYKGPRNLKDCVCQS